MYLFRPVFIFLSISSSCHISKIEKEIKYYYYIVNIYYRIERPLNKFHLTSHNHDQIFIKSHFNFHFLHKLCSVISKVILVNTYVSLKIIYRGFLPYATFGTWKKFALAKNRISKIFILCTR